MHCKKVIRAYTLESFYLWLIKGDKLLAGILYLVYLAVTILKARPKNVEWKAVYLFILPIETYYKSAFPDWAS